ncbi:unnamed protein product [Effrenium voratum]|nr:unnamed protein product [Effrenium voratum]
MFGLCQCEEGPANIEPVEVAGRPILDDDRYVAECELEPEEALVVLPASFEVDDEAPLHEPAVRSGDVWLLESQEDRVLQNVVRVFLSIHVNGLRISYLCGRTRSLAWSPFAVVQAYRFHAEQADEKRPGLRLFKVSDFHQGVSCLFAVAGTSREEAVLDRAKWVAAAARAIRMLTLSLFPPFKMLTKPVDELEWTKTRLLAGHMLLFDRKGVTTVFCELHAPMEGATGLFAYEDDSCATVVVSVTIDSITTVTERMGVDCSCFTLNDYHFAARSVAEKVLWLRAIGNVKVKLRHALMPTTDLELRYYRLAIQEQIRRLPRNAKPALKHGPGPFLTRRERRFWSRPTSHLSTSTSSSEVAALKCTTEDV